MALDPDTIVAISTPPGRGGIGIVRLSGPRAVEIVSPLLCLRHPLAPGQARFGQLLDLDPEDDPDSGPRNHEALDPDPSSAAPRVLDEIVATYFAAPHSYTGEDVVEIAAHGSPVLLEAIVRRCCAAGARLAQPGEFTQRAFLAGRIDLTQAEAVADLIASTTLEQARLAARQLGGALAQSIAPAKADLVALIAALEAGIDFAEDDIDLLPSAQIAVRIAAIRAPLSALERTFAYGRVVRDGLRLAIVGRPNAGKSSLFNRLVQRERAIVTAAPGTTRDLVTETVAIEGIPVELIDTAGLRDRDTVDEAERIGIAKSHQAIAEADVILLVLDAPTLAAANQLAPEDLAILTGASARAGTLLIAANKTDLLLNESQNINPVILSKECSDESKDPDDFHPAPTANFLPPQFPIPVIPNLQPATDNPQLIPTSALTGQGIPELRAAIVAAVAGTQPGLRESALLTNLRQHQAVQQALAGLDAASTALADSIPHEMLLLDLYAALRGLDALTGATTTDDVLRLIFSTFCIGK